MLFPGTANFKASAFSVLYVFLPNNQKIEVHTFSLEDLGFFCLFGGFLVFCGGGGVFCFSFFYPLIHWIKSLV